MNFSIIAVREDLVTVKKILSFIDLNKETIDLARALNLLLIATIDFNGITVFNRLQFEIIENEINVLRSYEQISNKDLDILEGIVTTAIPADIYYIKIEPVTK